MLLRAVRMLFYSLRFNLLAFTPRCLDCLICNSSLLCGSGYFCSALLLAKAL